MARISSLSGLQFDPALTHWLVSVLFLCSPVARSRAHQQDLNAQRERDGEADEGAGAEESKGRGEPQDGGEVLTAKDFE